MRVSTEFHEGGERTQVHLTRRHTGRQESMGRKVDLNPVIPCLHEAVVASDGKFEFENLPAGDYYIACPISREVLDTTSDGTTFTGGWASAKVSLQAGERKQIVLTR